MGAEDSAEAVFHQGFAHHREGRLSEAQRHYEAALRMQPRDGRVWRLLGMLAMQNGQLERAVGLLIQATQWDPSNSSAHTHLGNARHLLGQHAQAIASYTRALEIDPGNAAALNGRGSALHGLQRFAEAVADYDAAIQSNLLFADALYNRGNALAALHRNEEAVRDYDRVLAIDPLNVAALNNRGIAQYALQRYAAAIASYDAALAAAPEYADAHYNRANALFALRRLAEAIAGYDQAVRLEARYVQAHMNRGNALYMLKDYDSARASYDKVLELDPRNAQAHSNRGNAFRALGQPEAALRDYGAAIALDPTCRDAWFNQGLVLSEQRKPDAALRCFDRVHALAPEDAEAHFARGTVLQMRGEFPAAIVSYDRAISARPDYADAYVNRGNAFREIPDLTAAMADYTKALSISPDCASAIFNRAMIQRSRKHYTEAIEGLEQAVARAPDIKWLAGAYIEAKMQICEWSGLDAQIVSVIQAIDQGRAVVTPQSVFMFSDSTSIQRQSAQIWVRETCPPDPCLEPIEKRSRSSKKIRVGYFSSDFRLHPVSMLAVELFEGAWSDRFENVAFSFGPETHDAMRMRMAQAFDRFVDVRDLSERSIAERARSLEIDIAVDLGGFTEYSRPRIFALRAAPVQVSYLGYTGTMGSEAIDYLIADRCVIPQASRAGYCEKIIYLPNSYMPVDTQREISRRGFQRDEFGLPARATVYCSFGSPHKITPRVYEVWMRILRRVESSVLWLSAGNALACRALRQAASQHGVDPSRIVFAERLESLPEHLARHRVADVFLDTHPYNAHTTAVDALLVGLPVVTCAGDAFAARVGASLVSAAGCPELLTTSLPQYEDLAVRLGQDPALLGKTKQKLAQNRRSAPLFDTALLRRHLEAAFTTIHERRVAGHAPDDVHIKQAS